MASLCIGILYYDRNIVDRVRLLDHRVDIRRILGLQTDASHRFGELGRSQGIRFVFRSVLE